MTMKQEYLKKFILMIRWFKYYIVINVSTVRFFFFLFFSRLVCKPMGVESETLIPDAQITASSHYMYYYAHKGRLNGNTGWCQKTSKITDDFIRVDMGVLRWVCAVATRGKKNGALKKSYKIIFSANGLEWMTHQE